MINDGLSKLTMFLLGMGTILVAVNLNKVIIGVSTHNPFMVLYFGIITLIGLVIFIVGAIRLLKNH